ncbi:MAG TPA: hypothetical protein VIF57_15865 [Polyangia bacterium]|jgi:hypothetical protein
MSPSSDLPPWLRRAGAAPRATKRNAAATAAFALVLFGAGAGAGILFARRNVAAAPPPPPAPVCPPAVACPPPAPTAIAHAHVTAAGKRAKPAAPKALTPLPEQAPMDEGARTQALRAFAEKKAPELRDCIAEPDRGPPFKLGAAFEIGSDGAVDFVQILGADASPKDVKRCYANRLKRWRFPEDLLRGEEKLLVNFVL